LQKDEVMSQPWEIYDALLETPRGIASAQTEPGATARAPLPAQ